MKNDHEPMTPPNRAVSFVPQLGKLAIFVLATGALLYGFLSLVPPQYESVAKISLEQQGASLNRLVSSQISTLSSSQMVTGFMSHAGIKKDPEMKGSTAQTSPLQRVLTTLGMGNGFDFAQQLTISKAEEAQTIAITVRSQNPQKSAGLANDYARFYIDGLQRTGRTLGPNQKTSPNEQALIIALQSTIAADEKNLARLQKDRRQKPFVSLDVSAKTCD